MRRLVALDLPGDEAFVVALCRALDAGDAVFPVDQRLPAPAKARLFDALRPAAVVTAPGVETGLTGSRPVEEGDAFVVATSGTTGEPRGVVLTRAAVAASAAASSSRLGVDPARDKWLCCLPLSHVSGLGVVTRALATGTPLEVQPSFDVGAVKAARAAGPRSSRSSRRSARVSGTARRCSAPSSSVAGRYPGTARRTPSRPTA